MRIWPFTSSPADKITTFQKTARGVEQVSFRDLPREAQQAPDTVTISGAQLQEKIAQKSDRKPSQALAKDNSVNPSLMMMAHDPKDKASLPFIEQMALVGQVEHFHIVADSKPEDLGKARKGLGKEATSNTSWITNQGGHDSWTEDHGEFTASGGVIIPAILPEDTEIESWVFKARAKRYFEMQDKGEKHPGCNYATQGLMNGRHAQEELANAALSIGSQEIHIATSYVEGGNILTGHRADGTPYALVGRDSLAVTSKLLPGQADEGAAARQVAADYGLQPEHIIPLEQPGDFHLDMAMTLLGPGQVLLNDSRQVLELQKGWITQHYKTSWLNKEGQSAELEQVEKKANKTAVFEDIVEKQLKEAGLEVFRAAAVFPKSVANTQMNFLNLRQGKNDRGETFAISLGGDEQAEKAFAHTLLQEIPGGYDRLHFLDRSWTPETLQYNGGIKCRTKVKA